MNTSSALSLIVHNSPQNHTFFTYPNTPTPFTTLSTYATASW